MNKANFWSQVRSLQLHTNMRDHQALQSDDANLAAELQQFDSFSINVGQGDVPTCCIRIGFAIIYLKKSTKYNKKNNV